MLRALCTLLPLVAAHGQAADPKDPWQVRHMKEEHGVDDFDAHSFFTIHDSDNSKTWSRSDILNLYGLLQNSHVGEGDGGGTLDQSSKISEEQKETVYNRILAELDSNKDGIISLDEWREFCEQGRTLPDFGLGPGHHGDYEYEYEVHHWQKFHAKDDPDVKNRHPEDDEHDLLYHQYEHGDDGTSHDGAWAELSRIPEKYRKQH